MEVHEVARARLLRMRIRGDGTVRVSVPPFTSDRQIDAFVAANAEWLERALAEHEAQSSRLGLSVVGRLPLAGQLVPIIRTGGARPHASLGTRDGETVLELRGPPAAEPRAVERFLQGEARERSLEMIALHEAALGVRAKRVRIADPVSRWGSASTTGTISFSWRLALAPVFVFEYVAVHELCHLVEMNHSPKFWGRLAKVLPDYVRGRSWLKEHGVELHRWSAQAALGGSGG
jgi:predicted metal-dependent hydrolase